MRSSSLVGAAISLCLVLGATACSGGKKESEEDITADVSKALQDSDVEFLGQSFDEDTADCFAKIVVDEVGVEAARDLKVTEGTPSAELQDAIATATVQAAKECGQPG
jgi:hypothetical protein